MGRISRTVNPLHFEDLEPHRFEDLVRQLIYDFKDWKLIEATGRSGSDEGFDVRARENIYTEEESEEDDEKERVITKLEDRIWLMQCKREKSITPKKLRTYAQNIKVDPEQPIYGVIFAASCNFSKKSRDIFISVIREKGIQEFHLWGKAELEDKLFQPKNDHLLFAYFGFSLMVRRRSVKTEIRSKLSIKRKIIRNVGGINDRGYNPVLLRDAYDSCYPYKDEVRNFNQSPRWWPYTFLGHYYGGIRILFRRSFAYLADDQVHWDFVPSINDARASDNPWEDEKDSEKGKEKRDRVWSYWLNIPKDNQAWLEIIRVIPYERIVEVDKEGDKWFPHTHIYVEPKTNGGFFEKAYQAVLKPAKYAAPVEIYSPKRENRIEYFPKRFPKPKKQSKQKRKVSK